VNVLRGRWNHPDMDAVPDLGSRTGPQVPAPGIPPGTGHGSEDLTDEDLTDQECWEFLAGVEIGRLAVCAAGDVDIYPLNFVLDDGSIVFPSSGGTKLVEVAVSGRVAFEVDGYDAESGRAWSVVVKGAAAPLEPAENADRLRSLPRFSWDSSCVERRLVRIVPERITGRRFTVLPDEEGTATAG